MSLGWVRSTYYLHLALADNRFMGHHGSKFTVTAVVWVDGNLEKEIDPQLLYVRGETNL